MKCFPWQNTSPPVVPCLQREHPDLFGSWMEIVETLNYKFERQASWIIGWSKNCA